MLDTNGGAGPSTSVDGLVPPSSGDEVARLRARSDHRLRGLDLTGPSYGPLPPRKRPSGSLRRRHRRIATVKWLAVVLVAAAAAVGLRASVVESFTVPSATMLPTLQVGDRILVVKSEFLTGPIKRGEIIVFRRPGLNTCGGGGAGDLVKRVVALPGEVIWSSDGRLFVDGSALSERGWYDPRFGQVGPVPIPRTKVPAREYYVMGDNRLDSCDSRSFGAVPRSLVVGDVVAILLRGNHPHLKFL